MRQIVATATIAPAAAAAADDDDDNDEAAKAHGKVGDGVGRCCNNAKRA